jgi:hypothetical protein
MGSASVRTEESRDVPDLALEFFRATRQAARREVP